MSGFEILIFIFFIFVFLFILFVAIKKIGEAFSGRSGELETNEAKAVSKRTYFSSGESGGTTYYVTFELPSGERRELRTDGTSYGMIAEGDVGELQSRGKYLVSFNRNSAGQSASEQAANDDINGAHKCPACGAAYEGRVCPYCDTPYHK